MTDNSAITLSNGGTIFTGDAINLFQAVTLKGALKLYAKCGMIPTRGMTITKMLKLASSITDKTYKRGDAMQAHDDLVIWIDAARASMPIIDNR